MLKICKNCMVPQPAVNFYKHPDTKDGLEPRCKSCKKSARNSFKGSFAGSPIVSVEEYRAQLHERLVGITPEMLGHHEATDAFDAQNKHPLNRPLKPKDREQRRQTQLKWASVPWDGTWKGEEPDWVYRVWS